MNLMSNLNKRNLKALLFFSRSPFKVKNFIINNIERINKREIVKSFPYAANLNATNVCNLRCKFCEIHYFYKKAIECAGRVFPNRLDLNILKNHSQWLKYIGRLELSGSSGEAFTNPDIIRIIYFLKNKHRIRLSVNTNGLLINEKIAEQLIKSKFDSVVFSIHAGDSKTYAYLHGGDFNRVLGNLEYLIKLKKRLNSYYPQINIHFGLNRENAHSLKDFMKLLKDMGVDIFMLYYYYNSRNALNRDISFYRDVEKCNKLLKDVYEYAKKINLKMRPERPLYLSKISKDNLNNNSKRLCKAPWTRIEFKGCVEHENCEYICTCNRILLLRINYKRFYENKENSFLKDIWNHPILQFFRKTVNSKESNPICNFCRNPNTSKIRCLDNVEYSHRRDKAVKDFFAEFRKQYDFKEIEGLTVLNENPYKYDEKDGF